jgi:hypothetical protein
LRACCSHMLCCTSLCCDYSGLCDACSLHSTSRWLVGEGGALSRLCSHASLTQVVLLIVSTNVKHVLRCSRLLSQSHSLQVGMSREEVLLQGYV